MDRVCHSNLCTIKYSTVTSLELIFSHPKGTCINSSLQLVLLQSHNLMTRRWLMDLEGSYHVPALTLNNPPKRDSQEAVIASTSVKLIKVQSPLYVSQSFKGSNALVFWSKNNKVIILVSAFAPERDILHVKCHLTGAQLRSAANQEPRGRLPQGCVDLGPVLAAGPITQLTRLLTSRYLCCTAITVPAWKQILNYTVDQRRAVQDKTKSPEQLNCAAGYLHKDTRDFSLHDLRGACLLLKKKKKKINPSVIYS